jgi:hypothetical protein
MGWYKMRKTKKVGIKNSLIVFVAMIMVLILLGFASASVGVSSGNNNSVVNGLDATVCCEKTNTGLFCQDAPAAQCNNAFKQAPTACRSTSFCKPGTCYDSSEGMCAGNTPEKVCNLNNGTWSASNPAQCDLGCCRLGDQAAFVTLVRCKRLSAVFGLETNYNKALNNEADCVLSVQNQEKGACVYEKEFEKTCKITTRADCIGTSRNSSGSGKVFYVGKLCSAEELGTNCGPSKETTCIDGKDEIYFKDTCGNPANIYDASKVNDKEYWKNIKDKSEVCGKDSANANSASCGNCNYLLGSICRQVTKNDTTKPTYGQNICKDLNCKKTQNGKSYKHGESWCVFNDFGTTSSGIASVGSRFYKHICINGEEVLEQCADFRQQECIQDKITTTSGDFSQAACRVNRWQDCTSQDNGADCANTDKRDCIWKNSPDGKGYQFANAPVVGNEFSGTGNDSTAGSGAAGAAIAEAATVAGVCLPLNPPGLQFWEGEEAKTICGQANAVCIVQLSRKLFESESDLKCEGGDEGNCSCWDNDKKAASKQWVDKYVEVCKSMGDCGPVVNWVGQSGYNESYSVTVKKEKVTT